MAAAPPHLTRTIQAVIRILLESPTDHRHGLEIGDRTGLPARAVLPALARLERCGWVDSGWDEADPDSPRGPRRRWYALSSDGALPAREALALRRAGGAVRLTRLRPIGGTA